jgi:hypothetical protein
MSNVGSSSCLKQLASCEDIPGRNGLRFQLTGALRTPDFCSFIEENYKHDVIGFFREVAREMEEKRGVMDFLLRVQEQQWQRPYCVEVYFGDKAKEGPEEAGESGECFWCFPGAPLFPGHEPAVTAGECVLAEFSDQPHVRCSLDAKARSFLSLKRNCDKAYSGGLIDDVSRSILRNCNKQCALRRFSLMKLVVPH